MPLTVKHRFRHSRLVLQMNFSGSENYYKENDLPLSEWIKQSSCRLSVLFSLCCLKIFLPAIMKREMKKENEPKTTYFSKEVLNKMRMVLTYFKCHDIDISLQQQEISIEKEIGDD